MFKLAVPIKKTPHTGVAPVQVARAKAAQRAAVHPEPDLPPPSGIHTPEYKKPRTWTPPVPPVDDWERPDETLPMRTEFKPPPPWFSQNKSRV
jgi:hypothetical protein